MQRFDLEATFCILSLLFLFSILNLWHLQRRFVSRSIVEEKTRSLLKYVFAREKIAEFLWRPIFNCDILLWMYVASKCEPSESWIFWENRFPLKNMSVRSNIIPDVSRSFKACIPFYTRRWHLHVKRQDFVSETFTWLNVSWIFHFGIFSSQRASLLWKRYCVSFIVFISESITENLSVPYLRKYFSVLQVNSSFAFVKIWNFRTQSVLILSLSLIHWIHFFFKLSIFSMDLDWKLSSCNMVATIGRHVFFLLERATVWLKDLSLPSKQIKGGKASSQCALFR